MPSGFFADPARQLAVQLGLDGGLLERILRGSINLHYTVAERANQRRSAWGLFVSFGHLVDWGADSRPDAPYATRALPLEQPGPRRGVTLVIHAFLDEDADGELDAGEDPLEGIRFRAGRSSIRTGPDGVAQIPLVSGAVDVAVQHDGAVVDLYTPVERREIESTEARTTMYFAFRPAGRIIGRFVFRGEAPTAGWLQAIRVSLQGEGIRRETASGAEGEFTFGSVPEGRYVIEVDTGTLAEETRIDGSSRVEIEVSAGASQRTEFAVRRATARERFGVPPGSGPH